LASEILETLSRAIGPLVPAPDQDPRAPAVDYDYVDGGGRVGLIASVSRPFCGNCNRMRLTSDGKLRNCLFSIEETDIRSLLREGASDDDIARAIQASIAAKWAGHQINASTFIKPERLMHSIGG
jgi:cyclic pyranopterin phosphate synthase